MRIEEEAMLVAGGDGSFTAVPMTRRSEPLPLHAGPLPAVSGACESLPLHAGPLPAVSGACEPTYSVPFMVGSRTVPCPGCAGRGVITELRPLGRWTARECDSCGGQGVLVVKPATTLTDILTGRPGTRP